MTSVEIVWYEEYWIQCSVHNTTGGLSRQSNRYVDNSINNIDLRKDINKLTQITTNKCLLQGFLNIKF